MNKDLEEQLKELGPECRVVVNRLRAAKTVEPWEGRTLCRPRTAQWLIAASLLIALGLSVVFFSSTPNPQSLISNFAYGAHEYHQSVSEMIATQRPDGGWQNDFLTRRNAEVLAKCEGVEARIAYKKAMRNLRAKGIL